MNRAPSGPKTDRDHLMKDNLSCYCLKTFETANEKRHCCRSWTQGLWLKPPALCHWDIVEHNNKLSDYAFYHFLCGTKLNLCTLSDDLVVIPADSGLLCFTAEDLLSWMFNTQWQSPASWSATGVFTLNWPGLDGLLVIALQITWLSLLRQIMGVHNGSKIRPASRFIIGLHCWITRASRTLFLGYHFVDLG